MTNEEARSNLEKLLQLYDDGMIDFSIIRESIKLAIEALKAQLSSCSEIPNSSNLISRQDAIDVILADKIDAISLKVMTALGEGRFALTLNDACDRHIRAIEQLPSAEPEVIHCKDCKYMRRDVIFGQCWCNCSSRVSPIDDDEYCSRADRRKE